MPQRRLAAFLGASFVLVLFFTTGLFQTLTSPRNPSLISPLPQEATRQQYSTPTLFYVEHIMKCGGTYLCALYESLNSLPATFQGENCRVNITDQDKLFRPHILTSEASEILESYNVRRHLVMSEQGYVDPSGDVQAKDLSRFVDLTVPFWDTFQTILLVRDPVDRILSFYRMWGIEGDKIDDIFLPTFQLRADPYDEQRFNFITSHIVPGYRSERKHPGDCPRNVIAAAKRVIDKFDAVLNLSDLQKESLLIIADLLGIKSGQKISMPDRQQTRRSKKVTSTAATLTPSRREKLQSFNRCDIEVVAYANAKVKRLAATVAAKKRRLRAVAL